jgi:hypothetical protein
VNARLAALLAEDAGDVQHAGASARRAEVLRLHAAGALTAAHERVAAAGLLLRSDVAAEVEAAHTLALAAMAREPSARPLAATAYDRLRLLAGAPQKFGTQVTERDGRRELWPVDATTTDSERAKWGLPTLAELRRRASGR